MFKKLLIANRAEIAIRIIRTANELGIETAAVYSGDDRQSLHINFADDSIELPGQGVNAYLNIQSIINAALAQGCDAIHPGYGLLSESAELAEACQQNGLVFVGPSINTLNHFGDKRSARQLAQHTEIPVIPGRDSVACVDDVIDFYKANDQRPIMIKAVNGGGGRGMRVVTSEKNIQAAYERCKAESLAAFGSDDCYVERFLDSVRHIEVQILGDGDEVIHLWERDCSVQRRNQKILELAPAPNLSQQTRQQLLDAAVQIAKASEYKGLGTVEFLLEVNEDGSEGGFFFIETNPRIQVEHTITEEITGLDLVALQLHIASGKTLSILDLNQSNIPSPSGFALQARINTETFNEQGDLIPTGGTVSQLHLPGGPGIRVDTYAYAGYRTNPYFDSLLAKLIVHSRSPDLSALWIKAERALSELSIEGIDTNADFLRGLLTLPELKTWQLSVQAIEKQLSVTLASQGQSKKRYQQFQVDPTTTNASSTDYPEGCHAITSPLQSVTVAIEVEVGSNVITGQELVVVEAMKMQHVITAPCSGVIVEQWVNPGDPLDREQPLLLLEESHSEETAIEQSEIIDLDYIRPDLQRLQQRLDLTSDKARPKAIKKRHDNGQRTARENISELCDSESFLEYGQLVYAAQRSRLNPEELMQTSPADGIVTGIGSINSDSFNHDRSRVAILSYDASVMAGTQGVMGHKKTDRLVDVATQQQLPLVFFTEGGGGRPNDTDYEHVSVTGLDLKTFHILARHQGTGPKIAVTDRYCFAGNAAIFGSCDLKIATRRACIGMGGPAMIEAGGLGAYAPTEVGPATMQAQNGLVDILVENDIEAVAKTRQLLSYFQGSLKEWQQNDQRDLRHAIPEDRKRVYDIYSVIETLADTNSFLELKSHYGLAMITGFIRIEGKPMGLMANNPKQLGGAINAAAAHKAAQFITLCNRYRIPLLSLCDTPGFMVGPDSETEGAVAQASQLMMAGAQADIPLLMICLRKGYGLGAMAMAGGSFSTSVFSIAWPTGEFGGMGLEGGVRLGFKRELEAETDPEKSEALFNTLVDAAYARGHALSVASLLEIDAVIDPIDTRHWISQTLPH